MASTPAVTGRQLVGWLVADGWEVVRDNAHGAWLRKEFRDGVRFTTVKNSRAMTPSTTLNQILSVKQTGLGKKGLNRLIAKYGR